MSVRPIQYTSIGFTYSNELPGAPILLFFCKQKNVFSWWETSLEIEIMNECVWQLLFRTDYLRKVLVVDDKLFWKKDASKQLWSRSRILRLAGIDSWTFRYPIFDSCWKSYLLRGPVALIEIMSRVNCLFKACPGQWANPESFSLVYILSTEQCLRPLSYCHVCQAGINSWTWTSEINVSKVFRGENLEVRSTTQSLEWSRVVNSAFYVLD